MAEAGGKAGEDMRAAAFRAVILLALTALLSAAPLFAGKVLGEEAQRVNISDLVNRMEEFDGRLIIVEGEVVGDIMRRGDHAWITVNDDAFSEKSIEEGGDFAGYSNIGMGIWAETWQVEQLKHLGSYRAKGDRVRVEGTFYRVCQEHGGDTDIHARRIELLEEGHEIGHPFNYARLAVFLALLALCAWLWWMRARRIRAAVKEWE